MARVSIEDCLKKMNNRFALVTIAASRTRQMMGGSAPLVVTTNKLGVTSLREVADGLISANLPEIVSQKNIRSRFDK
jgi:DNA-directed RNA polymerase subunit omega